MSVPKDDDVPEWKREFDALPKIPVLDGEEWDLMRAMDEALRKESRSVVVAQLPLKDDSAKG